MKKTYMTPLTEIHEVIVEQLMALSLNGTKPADPNEDVLAPEKGDWDIWEE